VAMGVHVDGLDPLGSDHHGQFLTRRLGVRTMQETAAAENDAGGGGHAGFQKIAACGHDVSFIAFFCFWSQCRTGLAGWQTRARWFSW
jgi:hypothetical protein